MADRYLVASGNVTWNSSNTAIWSTSSGGATGASVPTASDDVYIDANSGTGVIKFATVVCRNLNFTGFSGSWQHDSSGSSLTISGGLTLSATMTTTGWTSGGFTFNATTDNGGAGWPITTNGKTLLNVTFNGVGGKWQLQDDLTLASPGTALTVTAGHFDTNNHNYTGHRLVSSNSNVRTLSLGSSVITLGSDVDISSTGNLTISANTAVVRISSGGSGCVLGAIDFNGLSLEYTTGVVNQVLSGAPILKNVTVTGTATTSSFSMNNNPVITGTLTLAGDSPTNRLLVQSNTLGTPRVITAAATSLTDVDFMDIAIVGPTGSTITSDSFNRADGALVGSTSDAAAGGTGVVWAGSDETWSIASNKASRSGSAHYSFAVVETGTSDQWVQTTYQSGTIGLVARYTDAANCIFVRYSGSSSSLTVLRGGVIVYIAGLPGPHNTAVAGDVITLAVNGNVVRVMKNGNIVYWSVPQYTTVLRQAESTLSGTKAGLATNLPVGASDDFIVKDLPNVTGTRLGDCLGNSGIDFQASRTLYAVAPGNFSSSSMWSLTSGGTAGEDPPLPQDDVRLDANSAAGTYNINTPRFCRNLDATGFTRSLTNTTVSTACYGSFDVPNTSTIIGQNSWILALCGRNSHLLRMPVLSFYSNLNINIAAPGGLYSLASVLDMRAATSTNCNLSFDSGTFNTANYDIHVGRMNLGVVSGQSPVINFGTSTCYVGYNPSIVPIQYGFTPVVNAASATIVYVQSSAGGSLNRTFQGGGNTYGTLTYTIVDSPGALTITGSNTFNTVNIGSGRVLRLTSGTTQKIGTLNVTPTQAGGVYLPDSALITIPDSASSSVTGDFDIRYRVKMVSWASINGHILQKLGTNQLSWYLGMNAASRNLQFGCSLNGTTVPSVAQATGYFGAGDDNVTFWIRVTRRASDGRVQFFRAADSPSVPTSWTQVGSDTTASSGTLFDSTATLQIAGGNYANPLAGYMPQTAYYLQILNGIDGAPVIDIDFTRLPQPYWADASGNNNHASTTNELALAGDGRVLIKAVTAGSAATLQVENVTNMNYVDLQDIVMNGADTYIGATSVIRSNVKGVRRGPKTGLGV